MHSVWEMRLLRIEDFHEAVPRQQFRDDVGPRIRDRVEAHSDG